MKELLDDIRILGIPLSVVTDLTAQIQFRKLVFFGLENSFDYIVTSEEAGFDKPHEAQFNIAIDKMRPNGKNIWMIGDNPINDIKGAKDAIGATTLQKIHAGVEKAKGINQPDAYFENFSDLRKLINKLDQKMDNIHLTNLNKFCTFIGNDPYLVRAGGNVSYKDDNIMWIKASGTCIGDAEKKKIFIPVNLQEMKDAFSKDIFDIKVNAINATNLKPSIETAFHALMRHKYTVHIHSISSLIHLVQENSYEIINDKMDKSISWGYVNYYKPGSNLAEHVSKLIDNQNDVEVIFLENHGVIIRGRTFNRVKYLINYLDKIFGRDGFNNKISDSLVQSSLLKDKVCGYVPSDDFRINELAINNKYINKLISSWALFPDHIVFLGAKALVLEFEKLSSISDKNYIDAPFIFVKNYGVLQRTDITKAQLEQLICYFNVLKNMNESSSQRCLSDKDISDLLNWDAEIYRQSLSK